MNNIYIKNNNQKRRIKDLDRSINSPIKFTHPKYYLLSDICLRLSDPSTLPNIRNTVPTGFFVARRGHREAMEFYFSAAYYVSIMYRLLFRCASIFSARSFETKAGHARGTAERTVRRPCDSFSISTSGSWGNLTSGKRVKCNSVYITRSDIERW